MTGFLNTVMDFYVHKLREILDNLSDLWLMKNGCAVWNSFVKTLVVRCVL